jgi:hypothetical protein
MSRTTSFSQAVLLVKAPAHIHLGVCGWIVEQGCDKMGSETGAVVHEIPWLWSLAAMGLRPLLRVSTRQ